MSNEKFLKAIEHSAFTSLHVNTQTFLEICAQKYRLSFQEIKQLIDIAIDLQMWGETPLEALWEATEHKKHSLKKINEQYKHLKETPKHYAFQDKSTSERKITLTEIHKEILGLGSCPVASPKTRCCNLLTLDAVESCGFDCSYCSIQSFYNGNQVTFDTNFASKLRTLELDTNKRYHIGTGQSSDSLMWGNRAGILDALFDFAATHPNVVLEFKTKSDNIHYFLENDVPKNILVTWSLNPQRIIDNEEKLTASLDARIGSAKILADKGVLVGFHFHPMIVYEGYLQEYREVAHRLCETFSPSHVALISMGTLTFIKPVIKQLRQRAVQSKILQMPMVDASGKLSYPLHVKEEMFTNLYNAFAPWHGNVYFYMCMEDERLWKKVFGHEYLDNDAFEADMLTHYFNKIKR